MGNRIVTSVSYAAHLRRVPRAAEIRSNATAMSSLEVLPATPVRGKPGLLSGWTVDAYRRIDELSHLPEDWDSYGAHPLSEEAANTLYKMLIQLNSVIQSGPSISLNTDSGLVAEWESSQSSLKLIVNSACDVVVYYHDVMADDEWEMPAPQCDQLDKWLWSASSAV
jgi:hypothetical protein